MLYEDHLEWNYGIKGLIASVAKDVNHKTPFPSGLVTLYWPKNNRAALRQSGEHMINHTRHAYNHQKYTSLLQQLEAVKECIFKYDSTPYGDMEKGRLSNQIVSELEACRLLFADKDDPESTIPLFSQIATLHIAFLWEQCYHHEKLFNDKTAPSSINMALREVIKSYYSLAQTAVEKLITRRRSLIGFSSSEGNGVGQDNNAMVTTINDRYEGGIGRWAKRDTFFWYRQPDTANIASNTACNEDDMKAFVHSYTEYVTNHYSAIMQLNILDVAELWTYLTDSARRDPIHLSRTIYDGPFGWFAREEQKPQPIAIPDGVVPACLEVWYGEWVARLKVTYTNKETTGLMGIQDGGGNLYQKHAFNNTRRLIGVKGIMGKFSRWSIRKLAWIFTGGKHGDRCGLRLGPDSMKFHSEMDRHHVTEVIYYNNGSGIVFGYKLLPDVVW